MAYFPFIRIILLDFSLTSSNSPFLTHSIKEPCTCHRCKLIATPSQEHTRRSFQMPVSRMAHRSSRSIFFFSLSSNSSSGKPRPISKPKVNCRVLSTMRSVFQPPKGEPKSKSAAGLSTRVSVIGARNNVSTVFLLYRARREGGEELWKLHTPLSEGFGGWGGALNKRYRTDTHTLTHNQSLSHTLRIC